MVRCYLYTLDSLLYLYIYKDRKLQKSNYTYLWGRGVGYLVLHCQWE